MNTAGIDLEEIVRNYLHMLEERGYSEFLHRFSNTCAQVFLPPVTAPNLAIPILSTN